MSMMMFLKQLRALLKPKCKRSEERYVSKSNKIGACRFSYPEIFRATLNFSSELTSHRDGFGRVYEGTLPSGAKVAVKRLDRNSEMGYPEFVTQVSVLSHILHPRIVSLIGFCNEGGERILVYEYVEKGNLRDRLYVQNSEVYSVRSGLWLERKLSWKQRLQICIDAAAAIHYLHSRSDKRVIHLDIKSANILVDGNLRAKLTGFEIAMESGPLHIKEYGTSVKGTYGYIDPEYLMTRQLTEKNDVHSFGVVMLEVLCARPALLPGAEPEESSYLAGWGMLWHRKGELERIVDPHLLGNINSASFKKYCETIEQCLRKNGSERPCMREVLWNLEMALEFQLSETGTRGKKF